MAIRSNELMIGDWVTFNDCEPNEIVPIKIAALGTSELYAHIDNDEVCDVIGYHELTGIPLTSEILERNGFVLQEKEVGLFGVTIAPHYTRDDLPFEVFCDGDPFAIWFRDPIDIAYVHQLQHLIRLCGVNQEIVL